MARTIAELPKGSRITDYISLGVVTKTFPLATVKSVVAASGRESIPPAGTAGARGHVLRDCLWALYMQSSYREFSGVCWKGFSGCSIRESRSR